MSPLVKVVGTLESRIRQTHLYLSLQIGVRGNKTSQLQHISNVPTGKVVGTLESRIHQTHLYLSPQIGVRSSKTSQCGSANRPSGVPQGSPRIWCLSKSLLVSYQLCQCVDMTYLPVLPNGSLLSELP